MAIKFVFTALFILVAWEQGCQAGKGFGGFGNIGLINQLRSQLIVAVRQATLASSNANTTIQNNIATAQNSIDLQVKASQNKAAASRNPQCANQLTGPLSQINSEDLKNCDQAAELQAVDDQCALLAGMHAEISQVYILCPFWPAVDQAKCIQDFSVGITTKITDSLDSILVSTADAVSASASCVEDESQTDLQAIANANNAFDECVKSASV